jgi:hypothetical protein
VLGIELGGPSIAEREEDPAVGSSSTSPSPLRVDRSDRPRRQVPLYALEKVSRLWLIDPLTRRLELAALWAR